MYVIYQGEKAKHHREISLDSEIVKKTLILTINMYENVAFPVNSPNYSLFKVKTKSKDII